MSIEEKSFKELADEAEQSFNDLTNLLKQMNADPAVPDKLKKDLTEKVKLNEFAATIENCKRLTETLDVPAAKEAH